MKGVVVMTVERYLRLVAGSLVLVSVLLAHLVSSWFLLLTGFVGLNLLQSAFSNWCPLMSILRALGVPEAHDGSLSSHA
jgi:hypothetical protein